MLIWLLQRTTHNYYCQIAKEFFLYYPTESTVILPWIRNLQNHLWLTWVLWGTIKTSERRWYSGEHICLPSSWPGFDSRPCLTLATIKCKTSCYTYVSPWISLHGQESFTMFFSLLLRSSKNIKGRGPTEIWTGIVGFKVQSANHYTMGPVR